MATMIYLASRSPRRHTLVRQLKRPFRIISSTHREKIDPKESPEINAMSNAIGKAVKAKLPSVSKGIVIGADTFLYFRGKIIGKPRSLKHAHEMLSSLVGNSHWVYTGLCVRDIATAALRTTFVRTKVTFNKLNAEVISRLLKKIEPLDKAGAYALQADRKQLVKRIDGSRTNVIGLPMETLRSELRILEALACSR